MFRREHLDEAAGELVELVALRNVPVQRGAVELREQVDALEVGVDAVRDRDVHDAVLARERHGGFRALLGQRKKPRARAATHDDGEDVAGVRGHSGGALRCLSHNENVFAPGARLRCCGRDYRREHGEQN